MPVLTLSIIFIIWDINDMIHRGICNTIDWNDLIDNLKHATPTYIGPSHKEGDNIPGLNEVVDIWNMAGFKTIDKGGNVGWDMFVAGDAFDVDIAKTFCQFVNISSYTSCWVSRINVGHISPWHWDVNDDEENLKKKTGIRRFHCHMSPPSHGHILVVENECFYNQIQGSVYEWSDRKNWHAGMNSGLTPKYLFNIW